MKTQKTLAFIAAAIALACVGPAMAQEASPQDIAVHSPAAGLSRADVRADLNLWLKAGMGSFSGEHAAARPAGYTESLARYHATRAATVQPRR